MSTPRFLDQVMEASGQPINLCYQCRKCTLGCPMIAEFDYPPNMVMRMVQLGMKDELLASKAIWMCVSCETCGTRCPNGIGTAQVMDVLREMCVREGRTPADKTTVVFHQAFVNSIRRFGRVHEATMLATYKIKSGNLTGDLDVGLKLFLRGKIPLLPRKTKDGATIKRIFSVLEK
jgi:heterodisulfide reductase subunit C